MTDLKDLARRVSELQGPSREVDAEIAINLDPEKPWIVGHKPGRFPQDPVWGTWADLIDWPNMKDIADNIGAPRYTASLDAAMTLVLEGCDWLKCLDERGHTMFAVYAPDGSLLGSCIYTGDDALALAAAALLARSEA